MATRKATLKGFNRRWFLLHTWPKTLESGEYEQGRGKLRLLRTDGSFEYCCLGVACDLLSKKNLLGEHEWSESSYLPDRVVELLGISYTGDYTSYRGTNSGSLGDDNDRRRKTFKQIAAIIRRNVKYNLFVDSEQV
jgi:hypothetical protein